MPKNNTEISIIIVHYKVRKELFACLNSIEESHPRVSYEMIVVDNDEEKTVEKELRKNFPHIIYISNARNNGWGGGVNVGVKYAKGEYIYLLNPDTIIKEGAIDKLMQFVKGKNAIGVVASTLLDKKGGVYPLQGTGFLTPFAALFAFSFINKIFPRNIISRKFWLSDINRKVPYGVDVAPLTASLIKSSLFKKIGGLDEGFFLYFEEYDIANKIAKLRHKNYIIPSSQVIHLWETSTKKTGRTQEFVRDSREYYFTKYYGGFTALFIEFLLRINKNQALLFGIIFLTILLVIVLSF